MVPELAVLARTAAVVVPKAIGVPHTAAVAGPQAAGPPVVEVVHTAAVLHSPLDAVPGGADGAGFAMRIGHRVTICTWSPCCIRHARICNTCLLPVASCLGRG